MGGWVGADPRSIRASPAGDVSSDTSIGMYSHSCSRARAHTQTHSTHLVSRHQPHVKRAVHALQHEALLGPVGGAGMESNQIGMLHAGQDVTFGEELFGLPCRPSRMRREHLDRAQHP